MSRVPSLSSPFLLGFDEIERVLDRVTKAAVHSVALGVRAAFPSRADLAEMHPNPLLPR